MNADFPFAEQIAAASGSSRWAGAIEGMHDRMLFGWAFDRDCPDARVIIELCLNGMRVACIAADVARTDLAEQFDALHAGADVCHGFVADLNALSAGAEGILTARVANTDVILAGSLSIGSAQLPPPAALNTVVGDGGLRLTGWAVDPANPRRTVGVRAFVGHELVAQTMADLVMPSMRGHVEGPHGFDLALPAALADGRTHKVRVVDDNGYALNGSPLAVCCALDGMAALLPRDTDDLVRRVAGIYEGLVPRSVPMSAWPEWSARFEDCAAPPLPAAVASLETAILVAGTSDPEALRRTAASLENQGTAVRFYSGSAFPALLAEALAAGCDVIACMRAGDTLAPHAIDHALAGFALPGAQVVYTDCEHDGRPWFKPAWNLDYALASDYPLDLLLVRGSVARQLPPVANEAQFAWSSLAMAWAAGDEAIVHVPRVLYRMNSPLTQTERDLRHQAAVQAIGLREPLVRLEPLDAPPAGMPKDVAHAARRVHAGLPPGARDLAVSLVIPTRDRADLMKRCLDSIRRFTDWPKLEIIVIDNGSTEPATHAYFADIARQGARVLPMPGPFNYADLNNRAIALASGDIVGLVNNDIEALHDGWLDEIVAQLLRPGVGAVGAKLLWPNGMVQHGGVLLGVGNVAGHFGNRLADADWGDHGRNQLVQRVSGCTAACLFLRRQDFLDVGGMDAHAFPVAFNDVDLCLKVRASGKAIIWTPHAKLLHAESASRGHEDTPQKRARSAREIEQLRQRWGHVLLRDPAYHPSLNLDALSNALGGLAIPPRPRFPRNGIFLETGYSSFDSSLCTYLT